MNEREMIAQQFEQHRERLRSVAFRMLGSTTEADDALQEAWLKVTRASTDTIDNPAGWLTTVVARVCLDTLRSRKARREEPAETAGVEPVIQPGPEHDRLLADAVGVALLTLLQTLAPSERLAFVLHDLFDLPFDEIASILGSSSAAARQLASRARRRVRGASADPDAEADLARQRAVIDAFLKASREGNLTDLVAVLAPDVVLRADAASIAASNANRGRGAPPLEPEMRGAALVAKTLSGTAQAAQAALIDGSVGAAWAPQGRVRGAFAFTIADGKVVGIEVIVDPQHIRQLVVELF
jgi:RNA polymerase sigma factor (sigma-70 family)